MKLTPSQIATLRSATVHPVDVTEVRPPSTYPSQITEALHLTTLNDRRYSDPTVVGTFSSGVIPLFSDIDVSDPVSLTLYSLAHHLHELFVRLRDQGLKKGYYFSDCKIGSKHYSLAQMCAMSERKLAMLMRGKAPVAKVDILFFFSGRVVEQSTLFSLATKPDRAAIIRAIATDGEAYLRKGQILKSLKRVYSIAKLRSHVVVREQLISLLSGTVARLSVAKADVESAQLLLTKYSTPSLTAKVVRSLQALKATVATLGDFSMPVRVKLAADIDTCCTKIHGADAHKQGEALEALIDSMDAAMKWAYRTLPAWKGVAKWADKLLEHAAID